MALITGKEILKNDSEARIVKWDDNIILEKYSGTDKEYSILCPGDPELDYHTLEGVHNGGEASAAFADLPNHTPEEIAAIRKNLLAYCGLDTLAMVKVLEKLRECAKE